MGDSLRDQLLRSGLVKPTRERPAARRQRGGADHRADKPAPRGPGSRRQGSEPTSPRRQGSEPTFPPGRRGEKAGSRRGKVGSDPNFATDPNFANFAANLADVDLARAWAMREHAESAERQRAKAAAEAEARVRKEMLQRLRQALDGKVLNRADAELVRHFEYGGRIRRVHVDAGQLADLNAGRLGVVQLKGGYVLVTRAVAEAVREFAPGHVALLVSPDALEPDDGVPDDLTW